MKSVAQIERILVPVPHNRSMIAPIRQAIYFNEKFGSDIVLLHVADKLPVLQKLFSPRVQIRHKKKVLKKFRGLVKNFFPEHPLLEHVEYEVALGQLIPSILKVSSRRKSDLIIPAFL